MQNKDSIANSEELEKDVGRIVSRNRHLIPFVPSLIHTCKPLNHRPLKIRADIRDKWDSPNAEIHSTVESLEKTLGHKIVPQVQWPLLYNAMKEQYAEKGIFVRAISRIVEAFYERFAARLENEATSEWIDQLLGELAKKSTWILEVEVRSTT
jgi:hypothetical protein